MKEYEIKITRTYNSSYRYTTQVFFEGNELERNYDNYKADTRLGAWWNAMKQIRDSKEKHRENEVVVQKKVKLK